MEELQDAGALHRAPGGGTGRGGQVLPGERGLGFPKKPSCTVERLISKALYAVCSYIFQLKQKQHLIKPSKRACSHKTTHSASRQVVPSDR